MVMKKKAGIRRGKKRKYSKLTPPTKVNDDFGFSRIISELDKFIDLLYRRM
jgi:hypothetical protein